MALFGLKKEQDEKKVAPEVRTAATRDLSSVIVRPRVTEKSATMSEQGVYTFVVRRDATKYDVRDAVKELFKVTPKKVRIVNRPARTFHSRARGRKGVQPGMRKAYVYLKKGDRIDLV